MNPTHGTSAGPAGRLQPHGDLTLVAMVAFALRNRRLILGTALACCLLVGIIAFARHRTYTSTARFMPQQSEGAQSRLSGLAASFGLSVPGADPGSSPAFYAELLKSRDVLRQTVETRYGFIVQGDTMGGTLVQLFDVRGATPAARRDAAAKALLESIDVTVGGETGTVDLDVTTPWAELSRQVGARMIQLVSDFNLSRRQTKAGAERRFVESRVGEAQDSLRASEGRLEGFLQRNRDYRNSPQLMFTYERLEREVTMRQQVYTTLAQSYEAARIDEVRNTPVITVMEPPDLPAKPDPRLALLKSLLAGIVGLGLGAVVAAARQAFGGVLGAARGRAPGNPDADEFARGPVVSSVPRRDQA
jgi:uncharacterized protein involved in exopolysaccharide biosynthesis